MPEFFPQLRPGSAMQYPLRKALRYRTAIHDADTVSEQRSADAGAARVRWDVQLRGLSDEEVQAIEALYQQMRGAHGEFVFLDPDGNLLSQSEDFGQSPWQTTAGLTMQAAATHPTVATQAWRMTAPVSLSGEVWQSRLLPSHFHWLVSVYARADSATELTLLLRSAFGEQVHVVSLTPAWKRYWFGGMWWPAGEGVAAGIRLAAGSTAEVSAVQMEMQSSPSAYKRTTQATGVYQKARFTNEGLRVTSLAPQCHQMALRIEAPLQVGG
jgi:hypothetical protein